MKFKKIKKFNYFNHQGLKKYAYNTGWLLSEKILRIISELLVGVWVARYLGPENFGIYSYSIAFVAIFGVIAKLGLDQILIKELIENKDSQSKILGTGFWLKVSGAFIAILLIYVLTIETEQSIQGKLFIFIISIGLIFESFQVIDSFFQSQVKGKFISLSRIIQLLISTLAKIYLIISGAELIYFIYIILIDKITLAVALNYSFRKVHNLQFLNNFDLQYSKNLLSKSWPYILTGVAIMGYMRIDQIMIKAMLNENAVGIYSAAIKISEGWYFIPTILAASLFPAIINAKKINKALYEHRMQSLYDLITIISLFAGIIITIFSKNIITFLYGNNYIEAANVLTITIWAGLFVSYGLIRGKWILAEGLQKYSPINIVSGLVVNVVLNFFLIPIFSIKGAAIATLISQITVAIIAPLFVYPVRKSVFMIFKSLLFISISNRLLKFTNEKNN